jgi:gamma-glutamyl hydrolase
MTVFLLSALFAATVICERDRPVVGVLTQQSLHSIEKWGNSYIAASYVKYLEAAGARVVPIFDNWTISEIDYAFDQIDGVLFPGGDADVDPTSNLFKAASRIYERSIDDWNNGRGQFTIFAHCLGFELLCLITSANPNLLTKFDASNITMPLQVTSRAATSRLFGSTSPRAQEAFKILSTENVTYNSHHYGVAPTEFVGPTKLGQFYSVLSLNDDRAGLTFVSTIEARNYPIYGLQWHPEKASFEWEADLVINHSRQSVFANNHMADFFINECRKSPRRLVDETLLIFTYASNLHYTGDVCSFEECYIF